MTFNEKVARTGIDPSFKPRWYQTESVDAVFNYFYDGGKGNPLVVAPTGAGKSHILGVFCKRVLDTWPDQRILILTHVDTIIEQDYLALLKHLPRHLLGIYSASVGRKERRHITVAGIQSISKKAHLFKGTTIILIDEAHTVPPKGEGQYRTFLKEFSCPIVGLTATHFRLGSGYLHEGDGRIFTDIAYEIDIERLIGEGFLCRLLPKAPISHIDTEGVHTQNGDFVKKELREKADKEGLTESIIADLVTYKDTYKKWLVFAIDIEHAESIATQLMRHGITTGLVHSKISKAENNITKAEFIAGTYKALVSVETLTTGFDDPTIDLIALIRPTKSPVLHIQMIGRGLRIHPEKDHCLVLDYAGNVERLGPINDVQVKKKGKRKGPPIVKVCPDCRTICSGSLRICTICGHEFEFKSKLKERSSTTEIIRTKKEKKKIEPYWYDVDSVNYSEHVGNRNLTLLVTYRCGLRTFFEYKLFDPGSKAAYHSRYWWKHRAYNPGLPAPQSTREAVIRAKSKELAPPRQILVLEAGKYPEIQQTEF